MSVKKNNNNRKQQTHQTHSSKTDLVRNGQIVVGNTMMLSLACDHRTIDGATGAQFLQTLKMFIENPVTMLA